MIDTIRARDTMGHLLTNLEELEPGIFCGYKYHREQPYAAFYVDTTGDIEARAETLKEFQDRVIGGRYFDAPQNLRWNSYLYFLAERERFAEEPFRRAKSVLEGDRNYARKFVVAEDELNTSLSEQERATHGRAVPSRDPVTVWRTLLAAAGLQEVMGDSDIAPLVRRIFEGNQLTDSPDSEVVRSVPTVWERLFLRSLRIQHFRSFPTIRDFEFGAVNLIRGSNGVGKTSMLEAIEYLYCGANARSRHAGAARLEGTFGAERISLVTTDSTPAAELRERNMRWYGNLDLKKSTLHESFSTFNFLNTDAAVSLSQEKDSTRLRDDLANLLVGPEAARIWGRLERVEKELLSQRPVLQERHRRFSESVRQAQERIAEARAVPRSSDELAALFNSYLVLIDWRHVPTSVSDAVDTTLNPLGKLTVLLESSAFGPEGLVDIRRSEIGERIEEVRTAIERIESFQGSHAALEKRRREHLAATEACKVLMSCAERYRLYDKSKFEGLHIDERRLRDELAELVSVLNGVDATPLLGMDDVNPTLSLAELGKSLKTRQESLERSRDASHRLLESHRQSIHRMQALQEQLHSLAGSMFADGADPHTCPLCATVFEGDELQARIAASGTTSDDPDTGRLSASLRENSEQAATLASRLSALGKLAEFSEHVLGRPQAVSLKEALEAVASKRATLDARKSQLEAVGRTLSELEPLRLTADEFALIVEKLAEAVSGAVNLPAIEALETRLEEDNERLSADLVDIDVEQTKLNASWQSFAATFKHTPLGDWQEAKQKLTKYEVALKLLSDTLSQIVPLIEERSDMTVAEMLPAFRAAQQAQLKLMEAFAREKHAVDVVTRLEGESRSAASERDTARDVLVRLQSALGAIATLKETSSLTSFTNEALVARITEIGDIFHRIHTPQEFAVQIGGDAFLRRREGTARVSLSQVSTGQRAAFALSIFLGMNLSAVTAPPIMLIDDPVAHIDDMNTLSFLDYLRDIVVAGSCQIFFATADDKLAALFSHKFSFLGDDFRTHELTRDS
ncbi:conserved hypothetical protein [Paraburkholderia ribeironis]|uniref:Rad50/SbcC-type AAA domain-containing protein n=1 Tax=Paraburkholderia ribeironis TaxID=1247936 RepID=A0A1N7S963_9BURK|nr:AAA family ATPase [Paraburkholderia ribeironis]SIT43507.1 conserved hypothetical protein [Paraburkholderia ribeironis]